LPSPLADNRGQPLLPRPAGTLLATHQTGRRVPSRSGFGFYAGCLDGHEHALQLVHRDARTDLQSDHEGRLVHGRHRFADVMCFPVDLPAQNLVRRRPRTHDREVLAQSHELELRIGQAGTAYADLEVIDAVLVGVIDVPEAHVDAGVESC